MKRTFNLRLRDKTVELYFDNEALYEFEEVHGEDAMTVMSQGKIGFRAITHFVYAGTLHDRKYSLSEIKKMVPISRFAEIADVITKALESALDTGDRSGNEETGQEV